jgi:beta-phosphoglucomutase family hydrolase
MSKSTWGAVFDFDGVIIDSASQHEESWERLALEVDKPLPSDHFKRSFGMKNAVIIPELLEWSHEPKEIQRLSLRKEELYREIVQERGIEPLPGVVEFLDYLKSNEIPRVIGSSTERLNITTALAQLKLSGYFDQIVSSEDVKRGKPDPEVFLTAAKKIKYAPSHCVVFEDAHVGVQAARAAKMRVVALTTTHPRESLKDADLVVDQLDQIPPETWTKWFSASRNL